MGTRHPFKQQERDTRAYPAIEEYLRRYGTGGTDVTVRNLGDHATMNEWRLSLNRGARHYGLSPAVIVIGPDGQQCYRNCQDPAAPHGVQFAFRDPEAAKAHLVREWTEPDPKPMKYNPYLRGQARHEQSKRPYAG
jgi:hypothetical protein